MMVYGWEYTKTKVRDFQKMRKELPEGASMLVAKNRLVRVAVDSMAEEEQQRWQGLKGQKGMQAYVFVKEEAIRDAVKAFKAHHKIMQDRLPVVRGQPPPEPLTQVKCLVMEGEALDVERFSKLEDMPTKQELLTQIARCVKQPSTKIARSLNQVPLKLCYALKAAAELNEDKSMTIMEAVEAKAAEAPAEAADAS